MESKSLKTQKGLEYLGVLNSEKVRVLCVASRKEASKVGARKR